MNTPKIVPIMLVIAAKISLFHVFRNAKWVISKIINPVKAAMAKITPTTSRSLGGAVAYLIFLFSFLFGRTIFLANSLLSRRFKIYPTVLLA